MSRAVVYSIAVLTDSLQYACREYVYCSDQFHKLVRLICSKEPTQMNHSFTNRTSLATRQIRGCFDVRMRLGQAAVDVIELHDSPLSGPEFTPSKGNANR